MSRIKRRSGNAVTEFCSLIGWEPSLVFQVGVGRHDETDCFLEKWPEVELIGCDPIQPSNYPGNFHQCLIADSFGKAPFYVLGGHKDGSSMFVPASRKRPVMEIHAEVRKLDSFAPGSNCLLWLDCEGAEQSALYSGRELFLSGVKMINVEMTGFPRVPNKPRPLDIHGFLERMGFLKTWVHTTRSCRGQFDAIYVKEELFDPRFCSDPASHRKWLQNFRR